eukprot:2398946-Rhodomonas_salina.1
MSGVTPVLSLTLTSALLSVNAWTHLKRERSCVEDMVMKRGVQCSLCVRQLTSALARASTLIILASPLVVAISKAVAP